MGFSLPSFQNPEKVLLAPPCLQPSGLDAAPGGFLVSQQVERQFSDECQILLGMTDTDAGLILTERDIERPMQTRFHLPMGSDNPEHLNGIRFETGDEISGFGGSLSVDDSRTCHLGDTPKILPTSLVPDASDRRHPALPYLFASMSVLGSPCIPDVGRGGCFHFGKMPRDVGKQSPLISFDCQGVISLLFRDFHGDPALATHGIGRHDATFDVEELEQFRYRGDLIGFAVDFFLTDDDTVFSRERIDEMKRPEFVLI